MRICRLMAMGMAAVGVSAMTFMKVAMAIWPLLHTFGRDKVHDLRFLWKIGNRTVQDRFKSRADPNDNICILQRSCG